MENPRNFLLRIGVFLVLVLSVAIRRVDAFSIVSPLSLQRSRCLSLNRHTRLFAEPDNANTESRTVGIVDQAVQVANTGIKDTVVVGDVMVAKLDRKSVV